MYDMLITGGKVYIDGSLKQTNLYIQNGVISKITRDLFEAKEVISCHSLLVLPGIIDPHVHLSLDLGNVTSCDDFYTGSVAAALGGVTTILDFLNPITHENEFKEALKNRMIEAEKSVIDYGFHATIGNYTGSVAKLLDLVKEEGIGSIKVFTTYSESNRRVNDSVLKELLNQEIITMVHAEDDELVDASWADIASYEDSRPLESELKMLKHLIQLKENEKGVLYVVHVTSGSGVEILSKAKNVNIESCPHYFYLTKEDFKKEDGALFLLAPPLRSKEENKLLNERLHKINTIGTDHCPFKKAEKLASKDASAIPKGIGSITYSFLLMYNKFGLNIIDKMSKNVADIFKLKDKGEIKEGYRADLFLFNPHASTDVTANIGPSDYSVYEGLTLKGKIVSTMVGGKIVVESGHFINNTGSFVKGGVR